MLTAYFDESIYENKLALAGFIGRDDQWNNALAGCNKILSDNGIPFIHMTDFCSPFSSQYTGVSMGDREMVIESLVGQIRTNIPLAISVSIDARNFEVAISQRFKSQIGTAYTIAAVTSVMLVGVLFNKEDIDLDVTWRFHGGHVNKEQLAQRLTVLMSAAGREMRISDFGFSIPQPGVPPPLQYQLADILVHSVLQGVDCLRTMDHFTAEQNIESEDDLVFHYYHLDLGVPLIQKAWNPIAELEASLRKKRKLSNKALRLLDAIPQSSIDAHNEAEMDAARTAVAKINRVMRELNLEEGLKLVSREPNENTSHD